MSEGDDPRVIEGWTLFDLPRIEDVKWYTGNFTGCIGIVLYNTGFGHKAYIGIGAGLDRKRDASRIVSTGCRFHEGAALWPSVSHWAE